jgi:hypothetical protein
MLPSWKTIEYRGGLVTFRIPSDWVEEYEADGGGAFYAEKPDSGTLRLNVMTLRSPSPIDARTTEELLRPRAQSRGLSVRPLPGGNASISYSEAAEEDGVALVIHYWEVANAVPPFHARLAVFSFTTLASEKKRISDDLEWLDLEICASTFASDLGVAVDES